MGRVSDSSQAHVAFSRRCGVLGRFFPLAPVRAGPYPWRRDTLPHRRAYIWKDSMTDMTKPASRPANARFSSGPCAKIPGYSLDMLADAPLGRSHRAAVGKAKLKEAIDRTRAVLGVPDDIASASFPASDTGAVEMAMWSLLGERPRRDAGLGKLWRRLGDRCRQAAEAGRGDRKRPMARSWTSRRSISTRTWSSPGTAPPRACACRTAMRSRRTVRD